MDQYTLYIDGMTTTHIHKQTHTNRELNLDIEPFELGGKHSGKYKAWTHMYMDVCIHICICNIYVSVYMYVYMCVDEYTRTYRKLQTWVTHIYWDAWMHVNINICVYMYVYRCVDEYMRTYTKHFKPGQHKLGYSRRVRTNSYQKNSQYTYL